MRNIIITEDQKNDDLIREIKTLQESNDFKDRIMGIVAHDLRDSFNLINGKLDILVEYYYNLPDNQRRHYIEELKESTLSISDMMGNLLNWSLIQLKGFNLKASAEPLSSLILSQFNVLRLAAEKKRISLINLVPPEIVIVADPEMIKTVIRNLLSNAIKFSHEGGEVEVRARLEQNQVHACVCDGGIGISPEAVEKIFESGFHFSSPGTKNEPGIGLGLKICKEFIELNGGRIWVESSKDNGSKFYFSLPYFK